MKFRRWIEPNPLRRKDTVINYTHKNIFYEFYKDGRYYFKPDPMHRENGNWIISDSILYVYNRKVYGNIREAGDLSKPNDKIGPESIIFHLNTPSELIIKKGI